MAWIELHQSLPTHAKLIAVSDSLDVPEYVAVGILSCLWLWALDNAPDGNLPDAPRRIARAIRYDGDADVLVDALVDAGFLRREGGCLVVHDWHDYAGKLMDRRTKNAERQARYRDRTRESSEDETPISRNGDGNSHETLLETLPNREDETPLSQHNAHVTVTDASRNYATQPNPTIPNQTQTTQGVVGGKSPERMNDAEYLQHARSVLLPVDDYPEFWHTSEQTAKRKANNNPERYLRRMVEAEVSRRNDTSALPGDSAHSPPNGAPPLSPTRGPDNLPLVPGQRPDETRQAFFDRATAPGKAREAAEIDKLIREKRPAYANQGELLC